MKDVAGLAIAIVGAAFGLLGTLMWEVLCLAGSPNSTPEQLTKIKLCMIAGLIVGLACLGAAVWLMVIDRPWWGAMAGVLPMAALFVALGVVMVW